MSRRSLWNSVSLENVSKLKNYVQSGEGKSTTKVPGVTSPKSPVPPPPPPARRKTLSNVATSDSTDTTREPSKSDENRESSVSEQHVEDTAVLMEQLVQMTRQLADAKKRMSQLRLEKEVAVNKQAQFATIVDVLSKQLEESDKELSKKQDAVILRLYEENGAKLEILTRENNDLRKQLADEKADIKAKDAAIYSLTQAEKEQTDQSTQLEETLVLNTELQKSLEDAHRRLRTEEKKFSDAETHWRDSSEAKEREWEMLLHHQTGEALKKRNELEERYKQKLQEAIVAVDAQKARSNAYSKSINSMKKELKKLVYERSNYLDADTSLRVENMNLHQDLERKSRSLSDALEALSHAQDFVGVDPQASRPTGRRTSELLDDLSQAIKGLARLPSVDSLPSFDRLTSLSERGQVEKISEKVIGINMSTPGGQPKAPRAPPPPPNKPAHMKSKTRPPVPLINPDNVSRSLSGVSEEPAPLR